MLSTTPSSIDISFFHISYPNYQQNKADMYQKVVKTDQILTEQKFLRKISLIYGTEKLLWESEFIKKC